MPEYCTCGAELPPDARFCHKCGKPQREEPLFEALNPPPAPPPAAPPVAPPRIGFLNPLAIRAGLNAGLISSVLTVLLLPAFPIWSFGAGFLGVRFYRRVGGIVASMREGAKMGRIAGLISFLLCSVPVGMWYAYIITQPDFERKTAEMYKALGFSDAFVNEVVSALRGPVAPQIIGALVFLFLMFVLFSTLGGMAGARVGVRTNPPGGGQQG